ncbi:MAG: DUF4097 family beta strand repeat-containing protein [Pyrinomonadaceae bacterium]
MSWLYTVVFAGLVFSSQGSSPEAVNPAVQEIPVAAVETLAQDETEKFQQTYPLNANGRVNISNVNGSIVVEAWDRNEVKLEYTKIADTKERLADVTVRIESKSEYFSAETDYDNWNSKNNGDRWKNGGKLVVEFRLMVPRGAVLNEIETVNGSATVSNFNNVTRVSAVNGSVNATNIRGTAKLSTVNGEVKADFDRLETGSKISCETVNGKVNLTIPSDANATVKVDSLNGNITNDWNLPVRKGKYVGRDLYGKLGNGEVQIRMSSVNGTLAIGRKNDGKSLSPALDLLPQKGNEDDDWNWDFSNTVKLDNLNVNIGKANKDIEKATKNAAKVSAATTAKVSSDIASAAAASANVQAQINSIQPEIARVTAQSVQMAADAIANSAELIKLEALKDKQREEDRLERDKQRELDRAERNKQRELDRFERDAARIADATFFPSIPRVERKSDSIPVKGTPKVTVNGRGCSVTVRGWDRQEVQYTVTQFTDVRNRQPIIAKETHGDSDVTITVTNPADNNDDSRPVRIEVFVPRKANLKIDASGTIRLEGVSGDLQVIGDDQSIDIRDSDGKLDVANNDGQVRIIGFKGELIAKTVDGTVRMDGDFTSIVGRASDGTFLLTIPSDIDADISGTGEDFAVEFQELDNGKRVTDNNWKFGNGSRKYRFMSDDGTLVVQNRKSLLADNQ